MSLAMLKPAFDRAGTSLTRPPFSALVHEFWSLASYRPEEPEPADLPNGQGQPVLVVPAFITGDSYTKRLRRFLNRCGFRAYGWKLGTNWGPTPAILAGLDRRVDEVIRLAGAPINLIGISLGGLLARELAHQM